MTMQLSQLRTYWNADDAQLIIAFLDELRDTLWATYGAEIIKHQQEENQRKADNNRQLSLLDWDDTMDF